MKTVASMHTLAAVMLFGVAGSAAAQGRLEDYQRAEQFVAGNLSKLVRGLTLEPNWLSPRSDQFWYVAELDSVAQGRKQFMLVDPVAGSVRPAFDHARLAKSLSRSSGQSYRADQLPFDHLNELLPHQSVAFTVKDVAWRCELRRYSCQQANASQLIGSNEAISPDLRWAVVRQGEDLVVRDRRDGGARRLTFDGVDDDGYAAKSGFTTAKERLTGRLPAPVVMFSPGSNKLLTYRLDTRAVRKLQVTQTKAGSAPLAHSYSHPLPGDAEIAKAQLMIFDLASGARVDVVRPPLPIAAVYESLIPEQMRWSKDGTRVFYVESDRGYKTTSLHVADVRTGADAVVLTERSDTNVSTPPFMPLGQDIVWSSERDGWNHLYLVDGNGGGVKRRLTEGEWVVFDILHVDAVARAVYFIAGGKEPGRDPYYRHLYRVALDGGQPQLLTTEDADHSVEFSPAGNYFVDTFSRMDLPPTTVVRAADGSLVRELQKADVSKLVAKGWQVPERFVVKSGDGVTDLHGVIYRPSNFDPARKYPVIDSVYPGPQIIATPKSFSPAGRFRSQELPLAELGFVVINMDAKGTPLRSRAFREAAYGKLGYVGGMEDHVVAINELARRHSFMDIERVGIFGHSGGGYATARAMLMFPDFYKVGVASNGNHDARAYWAAWGERYQGYPVDDCYDAQSNVPLAGRLRGKLLLAAGTLDDNVHPSHTMVLADALIEANKDFDLLLLPNRDHGLSNLGKGKDARDGLDRYFVRRRWDYFVRHLLGGEPPREYFIKADAS